MDACHGTEDNTLQLKISKVEGLPLVSNDLSQNLKSLNKEKKQSGTRPRSWCGGNLHPAPKQEGTQ